MDIELAKMVTNTASRAQTDLADLVPLLKQSGESEKDDAVKLAIGSAIYEINLIADRVFEQHPDLKQQSEARLQNYGRSYY